MKKVYIVFAFFILFSGVCFAQNKSPESLIVGEWSQISGKKTPYYNPTTWIFNMDGTLSLKSERFSADSTCVYKYTVTPTLLALQFQRSKDPIGSHSWLSVNVYDYSFTSDGNTLVLRYIEEGKHEVIWLQRSGK